MDGNETLSKRLRRLREKSELSQNSLGQIVGVSGSTIGHYESGRIFPSSDVLIRLANTFDTTCDYLMGRLDYSQKEIKLEAAFIRNQNMKVTYGRMIEILAELDEKDRENIYHVITSFSDISSHNFIRLLEILRDIS